MDPERRRLAYDCEFIEQGPTDRQPRPTIDLVSIGLVDIDNPDRTYYAVSAAFDTPLLIRHAWLWQNVAPHLPWRDPAQIDYNHPDVKPRRQIAAEVAAFILGDRTRPVELWADYGAYDHVVVSWLWGSMIDHPAGIPMWTHDLREWVELLDLDGRLPAHRGTVHHALDDAVHLAECVRFMITEREKRMRILPPGMDYATYQRG